MVKYLAISSILLLFACKEVKPGEPERVNSSESTEIKNPKYNFVKIYEGNVPCSDCSGTEMRLVLKSEKENDMKGVFRLKETYAGKLSIEDGISEVVTTGEFKYFLDKDKIASRLDIADPNFADTSARIRSFIIEKNEIALFRDEDISMNKKLYRLQLKRSFKI